MHTVSISAPQDTAYLWDESLGKIGKQSEKANATIVYKDEIADGHVTVTATQ